MFWSFTGIIHGDFHDWNLIVDWSNSSCIGKDSLHRSSDAESSVKHETTELSSEVGKGDNVKSRRVKIVATSYKSQKDKMGSITNSDLSVSRQNYISVIQGYAIIDFEEMSYSYPALEVLRLIADMMIGCHLVDLLDIGGYVIAGYACVNVKAIQSFYGSIYPCVLACLAQYIILSTHEYDLQGQKNEYVLEGTESSRKVLKCLQSIKKSTVYDSWNKVFNLYISSDHGSDSLSLLLNS